jgi:hypothetical protein
MRGSPSLVLPTHRFVSMPTEARCIEAVRGKVAAEDAAQEGSEGHATHQHAGEGIAEVVLQAVSRQTPA